MCCVRYKVDYTNCQGIGEKKKSADTNVMIESNRLKDGSIAS